MAILSFIFFDSSMMSDLFARRCAAPRLLALESHPRRPRSLNLGLVVRGDRMMRGRLDVQAYPDSSSDVQKIGKEVIDDKSETYSNNMTEAMGAVLTYKHELGMNYSFICPDLIVGSCLQTPADVDKLRNIGVKTIFCLQQDPDLAYFVVDIGSIQERVRKYDDIEHIRCQIRDFDGIDLRMRLPAVVSKLYKAIERNGGVTYVHCTAGLGRAPAVMLAYMFWILGYKLSEGQHILLSKRACFLNLDAIKFATTDILTGKSKIPVKLMWEGDESSSVEVSGLDIGWGQRIPLKFDKKKGVWILERELPEGVYEYKYIIDGEWTCNSNEPVTSPNSGGFINNYVQAFGKDTMVDGTELWKRLTSEDVDLTKDERVMIRKFLGSYSDLAAQTN